MDRVPRVAFFLVRPDTQNPDFGYRINQSIKADGRPWTRRSSNASPESR